MKKNIFYAGLLALLTGVIAPLASYGFCPNADKTGWQFTNEVLIWTAAEDGLAFTNKPANVLVTDDFTSNAVIRPKFKWNYGFRLDLGFTTCDRAWSFDIAWANIENKAHKHLLVNSGAPDFEGIYPIWSMGPDTLAGDYVSSARSNLHLHTNLVDLNAQYNWCWGERLLLMPFVGIRFASLRQKFTAKYEGGTFFNGIDYNKMHNNFYGVGPRLGLEGQYYLMYGFSIDAMIAVDPMYGRYHVTQREVYLDVVRNDHSSKKNHFAFCYDYSIALAWKGVLCEGLPGLKVSAAWEGHEFFTQNRLPRGSFHFFKHDRNLTLHGVTLSASFDF